MAPFFSFLLTVGALASTGAAWYPEFPGNKPVRYSNNTLITFQKQGCHDTRCGFVYHNFQPRTCAVTITRANLTIAQAIAAKLTLVKSGLLIRNETGYPNPTFTAWDEGKGQNETNQDGPLQCGREAQSQVVYGDSLCISAPDNHNYHGYSYSRPPNTDDNKSDNDDDDDDNNNKKTKRANIPPCTGQQHPDGVLINGKMYNVEGIPDEDRNALFESALNGGENVPDGMDKYLAN